MATLIQFKRGLATSWTTLNPLLKIGEPGFEWDTGKLKIGDGRNHWNDLPYINEGHEVFNALTHYDFPSVGSAGTIYKAESEKMLYQWNATKGEYEVISNGESGPDVGDSDWTDITIIHGGDADDYA